MRYLPFAPSGAIEMLDDQYDSGDMSKEERLIAVALLTDNRMGEVWSKLAKAYEIDRHSKLKMAGIAWGEIFFMNAINAFRSAVYPDKWNLLTVGEQKKWLDKLDGLVSELSVHLESSPSGGEYLGQYVPDEVFRLPSGDLSVKPLLIQWSLGKSLQYFAGRERTDASEQWMKRPSHSKASRERFIYMQSNACKSWFGHAMQEVVAITSSVVFNDDSITDRLVRRITAGRLDRQDSP